MTDSQRLLAEYVQTGSDAAFRELTTRYVGLVYSTARRLVDGDTHRAEDVAQIVFVDLARTARTLSGDVMLGGWLHRHTCFVAAKTMRGERRRQSRERQAVEMNALQNNSDADYSLVAPVLDEAINELDEADRTAILLRFFEQNDFRSVGQALGSNEDAARMRVTRALEKLEGFLKHRGVTTTATSLGVVLSANAVQATPVGLALTISSSATLAGTAVPASTAIAATKAIAMTTLQKTLITTTIAVAVGTGIYEARQASNLRNQVQTLQQQQRILVEQSRQLLQERDDATNRVNALAEETRRLNLNSAELLKLRGEVARLRRDEKDLTQLRASQTDPANDSTRKNILAFAAVQEKRSATNSALAKLAKMSVMLSLTAEQQKPVSDILFGNIESRAQVSTAGLGGNLSPEETKSQMAKILKEEDQALGTVLTPSQMAAYEQMKTDEANEDIRSYFKYESSSMTGTLKLSPEQAERVFTILCTLKPGEGGPGITEYSNPKEQLEIRLRALEPVLTPKQLEDYRQIKLKQIDEKLELSNLIRIPN